MGIEKRKLRDGTATWRATVYYRRQVVDRATFDTKGAAERWEREQKRKLDRGEALGSEADRTTLAEALNRYTSEVSAKKRGHQQELGRLKWLGKHKLALRPLSTIRGSDIATIRDELSAGGRSPATVTRYLALLSHLFNTARREWGMEALGNPVNLVKKPTVRNARERRLEEGEEAQLLLALSRYDNPWLIPLATLAIETALRKGELLSLQWENINLRKRTAYIPMTKNGESRTIPLSTRAIEILKELPVSLDGRVFATTDNATKLGWIRACARMVDENGIPAPIEDLRFHDLRHEATSRLAEIFAPHELAKITGHKDLKMLMRYYHPRAEDLAKKMG